MNRYTAIIPVAGAGTRLRPHTYTYPKVLLTVGDKPILGHIVDNLKENGFKKICFIIGYLGEKIKEYISANYKGLDINYIVQEEQKGLGHAIYLAKGSVSGPVFIILGDTIIETDVPEFLKGDYDKIAIKEVSNPQRFGVVEIEKGFVKNLIEKPEKPPSNLAIVGVYSFRDSKVLFDALEYIVRSGKTTRGEIQLTDALSYMVKNGARIKPVKTEGWFDCGKPETLLETNRHVLKRKQHKIVLKHKNCFIRQPVYIARTAIIENSIIGPYVSIGENCRIENSIISDSIINEGAVIKSGNLDRSLIGPNAYVSGRVESINIGENSEIKLSQG